MTTLCEPGLFRILYRSQSTLAGPPETVDREIERILEQSRAGNGRAGLTGALLFASSFFVQALEGPGDRLEQAFERICCDLRHTEVHLIEFNAVERRGFGDRSMIRVEADAHVAALFAQVRDGTGTVGSMTEAADHAVRLIAAATGAGPLARPAECGEAGLVA